MPTDLTDRIRRLSYAEGFALSNYRNPYDKDSTDLAELNRFGDFQAGYSYGSWDKTQNGNYDYDYVLTGDRN